MGAELFEEFFLGVINEADNKELHSGDNIHRTSLGYPSSHISVFPFIRRIPYWGIVTATALLAIGSWLPWLPSRFSLRTLLIAATLVAVVLGLVARMSQVQ